MYKGAKILITGGAGFIGTNLLIRLSGLGARVRAVVHRKPLQVDLQGVERVEADLTNADDCQAVVKDMDYVFMCAANTSGASVIEKTPLAHVTPNVIMNTLMMDASYQAGVKKFLFVSSNTVYPDSDTPVKEEEMFSGEPYGKYFCVSWMKRFGEVLGCMYADKINRPMAVVVVRPGNVYGPYDDFAWATSHVLPALIRKVVERHDPVEVWGDGSDIKDFIYVDDLVEGMLLAMEKQDTFEPLNIASGQPAVIKNTLDLILLAAEYQDARIAYNSSKPTMIPKRLINIDKARKQLGFEPKTSLTEGLAKTVAWYRENSLPPENDK